MAIEVTIKRMLEAGVHFGHQKRRWNPKMAKFIFGERNGIYIIDLQKTAGKLKNAIEFVRETTAKGGSILFIGTKKQAQIPIREEAGRAAMPYVNHRWLGGTAHELFHRSPLPAALPRPEKEQGRRLPVQTAAPRIPDQGKRPGAHGEEPGWHREHEPPA